MYFTSRTAYVNIPLILLTSSVDLLCISLHWVHRRGPHASLVTANSQIEVISLSHSCFHKHARAHTHRSPSTNRIENRCPPHILHSSKIQKWFDLNGFAGVEPPCMKEESMWRCVCVNMEALGSVQHAGGAAQTRTILEPHFSLCATRTCSVKLASGKVADAPCEHSKPPHLIVFDTATVTVYRSGFDRYGWMIKLHR